MTPSQQQKREIHHPQQAVQQKAHKAQLLWIVLGLSLGLFLAELGVGLWSRSLSLLAAAGHMLSDVLTVGIALVAIWLTKRTSQDPDNVNSQSAETWAALINGLILTTVAAFIGWEAVVHFQTPEPVEELPMLGMAVLALLVKGLSASLLYENSHDDLNVRGVFLHAVADTVSFLGVIFAALAIYYLDWLWADAIASLLIAIFIGFNALLLVRDSVKSLAS